MDGSGWFVELNRFGDLAAAATLNGMPSRMFAGR
jgi:hypothetical protein